MSSFSKERFYSLRRSGMSYADIADAMGVSKNTVKSFARRNGDPSAEPAERCTFCHRAIDRTGKRRFCSAICRYAWNYSHRVLNSDNSVGMHCRHCGRIFFAYPSAKRKYCSRTCYIADRYTKVVNRDA